MTIKTLVEVRGGRVSIVEDGNETRVTIIRNDQNDAVADLSAGELASEVQRLGGQVRELVAERDALLLKVESYNLDRHTEKQRADENQGRLTTSRTWLESAQQDLNDAKASLTRIQGKVWKDTLDFAMNHRGAPEEIPIETVGDLANAVSAVRSIVGQP